MAGLVDERYARRVAECLLTCGAFTVDLTMPRERWFRWKSGIVGGGPIQVSPAFSTASANRAFSARYPYPGCTASAPESVAARSTRLTSR
jgi:hypothetical protein